MTMTTQVEGRGRMVTMRTLVTMTTLVMMKMPVRLQSGNTRLSPFAKISRQI
mgnify:CR=1 FL=1